MSLRVVAGELGGRLIDAPPGRRTRPTSERVREAWFSALGERLSGAWALDLFAGSGALGIEALSRGAARVHFVESGAGAVEVLRRNLDRLGVAGRAEVFRRDVFRFLGERRAEGERFDLALADPPYGTGAARRLVEEFRAAPFARLLCVEHEPGGLEAAREAVWTRRYGDTCLTFVDAPGDPEPARRGVTRTP